MKLLLAGAVLFVLLCSSLVVTGKAASMWILTYGGVGANASSLVATSDGGYTIAGSMGGYFWLAKIDALGNMEWNKTYGNTTYGDVGTAYAHPSSLVEASDGGYVIAGSVELVPYGYLYSVDSYSWVVKTDAVGNMEWNRTYGGQYAYSVAVASDGGYAIALDKMLVKTDVFGNLQWSKSDTGYLVATPDGGYVMVRSFALHKIDAFGNVEWSQAIGGTDYFNAQSLIATPDGGYAIAGDIYSTVAGINHWGICLVKIDELGMIEWNQTYNNERGYPWSSSLIATSDGGYAIASTTQSIGNPTYRSFWLVKTDAYGNMEWSQTYADEGHEAASSLVEASDGGYVIAGSTDDGLWLVKTDELGIVPEYTSWLVPALVLTATSLIIINKKRLFPKRPQKP